MQDLHVKQPLQLFRIPCICGGLHSTGSCTTKTITKPTAPTTPTTTSATKRKSRQHGAASEKRRWSEFRRQARRRKFTVDITERHYLTLIKQPCGYCGSRQEGGRRIGVDRVCNAEHYTTENTRADLGRMLDGGDWPRGGPMWRSGPLLSGEHDEAHG